MKSAPSRGDIDELLAIMARLRDPAGGCPWDVAQNFETIAPYTIEEAYEVVDAIDRRDHAALRDELGDLLLQVVFHARIAEELGWFDFHDVVRAISGKLVRRHPHVFAKAKRGQVHFSADPAATEPAASKSEPDPLSWEAIKRAERGDGDASALAGVARGLPEWRRALKLTERAATVGFDWPGPGPVLDKLDEETAELRAEFVAGASRERLLDEVGDVLFVLVNLTRHARIDFSQALRHANAKFERRFRRMEELAAQAGETLAGKPLADQDALWDRAKAEERADRDRRQ